MKEKIYQNRKTIGFFSIFLFLIGLIMAYFYWETEPQETISGALCGLGLSFTIIAFSLKKPTS